MSLTRDPCPGECLCFSGSQKSSLTFLPGSHAHSQTHTHTSHTYTCTYILAQLSLQFPLPLPLPHSHPHPHPQHLPHSPPLHFTTGSKIVTRASVCGCFAFCFSFFSRFAVSIATALMASQASQGDCVVLIVQLVLHATSRVVAVRERARRARRVWVM